VTLSPIEIGYVMIALVIILMFLRMPIGVTMLLAGLLGLVLIRGFSPALSGLGIVVWRQGLSEILIVIPLFTWMGMLASYGGISKDAFASLYRWVGHLPGGLAMACTGACAAFGAVCGNHIATAVTMGTVALPEMRRYKYADSFSLGCIASSGNLGIMIPPSGAFILYGFLTETSIAALFIAGILPGLLITFMFCIQIALQCKLDPTLGPAGPRFGWKERVKSIKGLWAITAVFVLVMGGIYFGIFTPTEAASFGVFVVLIVGLVNRQLKWQKFVHSLRETMLVSAMIMLMIIGAMFFGTFTTTTQIPNSLSQVVSEFGLNRYVVMSIILFIYLLAGFVLDIFAILVITLPIFFPIVKALGFDALHFGVMAVLTVMMGSISPPFGIVVFAISGMNRDVPIYTIFRGVMPFFITMLISLILILLFPEISTFLPDYMFPYR
jgi:C4-dicarboxylate transporter, DctM subunit